jgi:hypothetical protein
VVIMVCVRVNARSGKERGLRPEKP